MDTTSPKSEATSLSGTTSAQVLVTHDGAPAAQGGLSGSLLQMAPLFLVFAVVYFVVLQPQQKEQKKHQELLAALKKGDMVVTSSGMHGTIFEVRGDELVIEVADRVRITFERSAVQRLGGAAADAKAGG
jgi:preprotein translocase subunit YajC